MDLAVNCYEFTKSFPKDELFGMVSQIRRAASSIPANIAEGYGREATGAYVQHLKIAQGSLKELETHILLSSRLGFVTGDTQERAMSKCDEIGKMLRALVRSLQSKRR